MSEPLVCAVCLTKDRPAMLQRAIRCFRAQTYENNRMLIYNTGSWIEMEWESSVSVVDYPSTAAFTIGELRNEANDCARDADIIMHWDDDDWSAPTRMAEQVAALESGEYDASGYSDMLFWDSTAGQFCSAWLYTAPHQKRDSVLGTSLAYWRETWERKPFRDTSRGEDFHFYSGLRVKQVSSLPGEYAQTDILESVVRYNPRMVALIHGSNECSQIIPGHEQWRRVPEWDTRLKAIMEL